MDSFDELAQALARGVSRRQALRRFAGGVSAAFVATVLPWRAPAVTYARGVSIPGVRVSGIQVSGVRVSGTQVSGVRVSGTQVSGVRVSGVTTSGAASPDDQSTGAPAPTSMGMSPMIALGADGPDVEAVQYLLR